MGFGSGPSLGAALLGEGAPGHVVERARAAERGGLDSLWFIEDYFQTGAFAMAGAAAAVTTRIGLGLGRGQSLHASSRPARDGDRHPGRRRARPRGAGPGRRGAALDRGADGDPGAAGRSARSRECVDVDPPALGAASA